MGNTAKITVENVHKHFGGLRAVDGASLTIETGSITGLIGPNGAGKTTLFNVITGLAAADTGSVALAGRSLVGLKPHAIARSGVARTFQNIRLFANLSALENVMIGRHARTHAGIVHAILRTPGQRAEESAIEARALELLDYVGIASSANALARNLAYGDQRRLEIARALATEPRLLALDEPAAGMNPTETRELQRLLERIRRDGVTLLVIEHDMRLVMELCDRVLVLDFGRVIADGPPRAVQRDPAVVAAYLGAPQA
jgi:branched-chain amino acid transport system ATP-binding protein